MRISRIEAIPYVLPYEHAPRFASGDVERAENVLVRIHTDEGLIGQAEAQPRPYMYGETQVSIVGAVRNELDAALLGVDPLALELAQQRSGALKGNNVARAAVDLAFWDLVGRAPGEPCRVTARPNRSSERFKRMNHHREDRR